ncbi:hypothetical protein PF008_g10414 [Phytophthora fragariae]|uniref:B box-type domain-containing protein n=1 Tax=Phytophthora fragariae TaxID=53985 RepID=A0A6G0RTW4_9STRA|nr:hypothetical protein PF008_g10414 [Phytophthora fragariae]
MLGELDDGDILGASYIGDEPQDDEDAGGKDDEVAQAEKGLYCVGDTTEALVETGEEDDASDHQQAEHDDDDDREIEQPSFEKVEERDEFVAAWIRTNFPDVVSEAELRSQATAFDTFNADSDYEPQVCEECSTFPTAFTCEECDLTLCFRCTDAIHIISHLSAHSIRFNRFNSMRQAPISQGEARIDAEASEDSTAVQFRTTTKTMQEPPPRVATKQVEESRLALPAGTSIFFRAPDRARWPRELLYGTLVSREPATTSNGDTFYHRVLWLRGVEALPNGFFRASLALPGWNISSDSEVDIGETFWPHEIGVYPTQLGALRAVVTAEQIARAKFRRELEGGRIHRWRRFELEDDGDVQPDEEDEAFPSSQVLDEIVAETAATLASEFGVRLTRQEDATFHRQLSEGTWNYRKWMETIGRSDDLQEEDAVPFESGVAIPDTQREDAFNEELEAPVPTPWAPAGHIRFFLIAQHELVFPERVCRQHLRAILEQLLFVYAGFAWKLWREYVERHREREEQQNRDRAAEVLQAWARQIAERERQQERRRLLSLAIGSSVDALELYRRRQIEARKLYEFLTRQIEQRKRNALQVWRVAVGPSSPPPPPAMTWHPSHGMKAMLPKLPRMGARRRTVQDKSVAPGTQVIVEDMAAFKLFRANHTGPADTSYWVIRGRVLAGACPIGPAFREARRLVSRTDFATSVLLQQISVFVCLMEPQELKGMETTAAGGSDTEWSYERQVRSKYQALCMELKGAETISKRHVELAQQALVDFDVEAANAAAAAMGGSGTKNSKRRRASMTMQQQIEEDAAEEVKTKEAREALDQRLQLAEQQALKAAHEVARLGMMQIEFLYFPIVHDGVPDSDELITFLEEQVESRLRAGKNIYVFSRLGHGRTGLVSALLLGRVYGIPASEALERAQRTHDCQRPGAPRGLSFCSPTTASQSTFVRRTLARWMDPIYAPIVLENSEGFRSTRMQQRGLLAEPYLRDEGFMISTAGDAQAREREALELKRLERIARRESTAAALQRDRRKQRCEHETMETEESVQAAQEVMGIMVDKVMAEPGGYSGS